MDDVVGNRYLNDRIPFEEVIHQTLLRMVKKNKRDKEQIQWTQAPRCISSIS